jgi:hypothetical protein
MIWSQRDDYLTPISGVMSGERCKARPGKHILLCAHPHPWQASASDIGKRQMRNRVFHQTRIAGVMFEGIMTGSGPTLSCQINGSVALGVSGLRRFQPEPLGSRRPPPSGWWVVKYRIEERIFLPDFDRAAIRELSDAFGLVVLTDGEVDPSDHIRQHYFFTSPAWDGLRQWATEHPRLAKTYAPYDPYLPRWHERAVIEAGALSASAPTPRPPERDRGSAWL